MNGASFGYLSHLKNYKYSGDLHLQKQVGLLAVLSKPQLLIPASLGINQNGACLIDAGAKLTILGSVITDCGDKHYNIGRDTGRYGIV